MIPVLLSELRRRRWATAGWSLGISAYIALNLLTYPIVRDQSKALGQVLASLPGSFKTMVSDSTDLLSPAGFMSSKILYLILPMLFTVLAVSLGSTLLAREERSGTLELLLARPLPRRRLLAGKMAAGLAIMAIVTVAASAIAILFSWRVGLELSLLRIMQAIGLSALMGLMFGGLALALSALGRATGRGSAALSAALAVGGYLVVSLEGLADWLRWPAKLLPYHYYQPTEVLLGGYNWLNAWGFFAITVILAAIAMAGFSRRDIGG
ncbi:MAG: hypothetical protein EOT04_01810 [Candidatus Chaera renei]|uniref:ABC transporter permease n=1 Tax=Candidatus Chaera renei TaxID=2506947 RepID=A0A4Q0AIR0_9BACT|nr:MAG: hypothetical protein EOT04_01810 [Candidatus Chaera renei]